jgi:predicted membrane protein
MKTWKIFWGIGLILAAAVLLLDAFGVITPFLDVVGGISAIQIVGALLLISFIISRIIKLKFAEIFVPLALIFMIFEKNIAFYLGLESDNIINNWLLVGCAILLAIGVGILTPKRKKEKVFSFKSSSGSKHSEREGGSATTYFDCKDFVEENISNRLGETVVHFENEDEYTGGGVLNVDNKLGETVIYVSSRWNVRINVVSHLGATEQVGHGDKDGPTLTINGNNALGEVLIKFV